MADYEKLGSFYLGRRYDLDAGERTRELVLYDSRDLVTHAVCVGMTGSGKTGLCVGLLEEAAIDGVPAIVIDPKGDLSNLLLTFPELRPEDFRPWINEGDAQRKGLTPDAFAAAQATLWREGLAEWDQDGGRIARLRASAEFEVYTPGSSAGRGVSILRSLDAPDESLREDAELMRERVASTASSVLGLAGIDADPVRSREHILVSALLARAWDRGESVGLGRLVHLVQSPGMTRIGVMELEGFYPASDRFALAMSLNTLVASPGFERWTQGDALDIGAMLHTRDGRPRVAVFSIAHLSDAERMFFVSLLLNQVLGWTRTQSGTTSLRALVYMDEIAGYFPPVGEPASKRPLLTLMKQARAFGVGVVLATQNPVDIDYKGLSNAGTWFIGRLQTQRDKDRVLDGLEGASAQSGGGTGAGFDRATMDALLSRLGSRVFLMHNVHDPAPTVFETRWTMSYLRGPMTRQQIRALAESRQQAAAGAAPAEPATADSPAPPASPATGAVEAAPTPAGAPSSPTPNPSPARGAPPPKTLTPSVPPIAAPPVQPVAPPPGVVSVRPVLPPEVPQFFLRVRGRPPQRGRAVYQPTLLGSAAVYFRDAKLGVECRRTVTWMVGLSAGPVAVDWEHAAACSAGEQGLEREPDPRFGTPGNEEEAGRTADGRGAAGGAGGGAAGGTAGGGHVEFDPLPAEASTARSYEAWKKRFAEEVHRREAVRVLRAPELGVVSGVDEGEGEFRARLAHAARERRDEAVAQVRAKYAARFAAAEERVRRAGQQVDVQRAQARDAKMSGVLGVGTALLSALLGRKTVSGGTVSRAATAAKGVSRAGRESGDVGRAEETLAAAQARLDELRATVEEALAEATTGLDARTTPIEQVVIRPKKADVSVRLLSLVWAPFWVDDSGVRVRAWE